MPTLRIYLIGYEPPGWDFGTPWKLPLQLKLTKLMREADAVAAMPKGWPVGDVMIADGRDFVCTRHEHDGKIVIARPVEGTN